MRLTIGFAVLISFLTGCGDSSSGPSVDAHVGTFNLATVNGESLPADLGTDTNGVLFTALSGHVTLNADGTASDAYTYRLFDGVTTVETPTTDVGTYTRSGTAIVVAWASGPVETFSFDGSNELTATFLGAALVYRK